MGDILVSTENGAREIAMARPSRKNALTSAMYEALIAALEDAARDPSARAVLIRGEGGNFTSGNDLQDFVQNPPMREDSPVLRFLATLAAFEKPVVAAVCGHAVGIGATMLLHCDLVYAAHDAKLQLPFVNLALVPEAASSFLLPRLVGHARATELLFFGESFDAKTAKELGVVNQVVPAEELFSFARAKVGALVQKPADALAATKRLLKAPLAEETRARMRAESAVFAERLASAEFREAAAAFFEKRPPRFHGTP